MFYLLRDENIGFFIAPMRIAPMREAMARSVPRTELVELGYLSSYPLFDGLR